MQIDAEGVWRFWAASQNPDRETRSAHESVSTPEAKANSALWDLVELHHPSAVSALADAARSAPSEDTLAWLGAGQLESWLFYANEQEIAELRELLRREPNLRRSIRYSAVDPKRKTALGLDTN